MSPLMAFLGRPIYKTGEYPGHPSWSLWTLDYELLHQLILKALLEDIPEFLTEFVPLGKSNRTVEIKPFRGIYDLAAHNGRATTVFEIKVWSRLYRPQIERQVTLAKRKKYALYYLLLGREATKWSRKKIRLETEGCGAKIGYEEILTSLDYVSGFRNLQPRAASLAKAYQAALLAHRQLIVESDWGDPDG